MAICEVCVDSVSGAAAAEAGGADRIELCAGLVEGGITPSSGMMALVCERFSIDTVVLIRPRGGDFLYTGEEFEVMLRDTAAAREAGAYGVATGVLTADGRVDPERTARLIAAARPLRVTFHRAFDMTRDPRKALETLIELGVDRVLTSGRKRTVPEGLELIRELVGQAAGRISVMPGGGVRESNVRRILELTGAGEVHFTAFLSRESPMTFRNPEPFMRSTAVPGEYDRLITDPERVRDIVTAVGGLDSAIAGK